MPWQETLLMDQRVQFIADYQRDVLDVAELARHYGISRKTAYKWIDRYDAAGPAGLVDRSRRPAHSPQATPELIVLALLEVRRLGILPELIAPASPQQNGRHERMHRTLKGEATRPPSRNLQAQQVRFNRFRQEYNDERPHEVLDQETPTSIYHSSPRRLPRTLAPMEYPGHFEVRLVSRNSGIRWKNHWVCVTHTLAGEYVGLEEVHDGLWDVYFGPVKLGRMNERILRIEDSKGRTVRRATTTAPGDAM
jgi:putative transposase